MSEFKGCWPRIDVWYVEAMHQDPDGEEVSRSKVVQFLDPGFVLVKRDWWHRRYLDKWARIPVSDLLGVWP